MPTLPVQVDPRIYSYARTVPRSAPTGVMAAAFGQYPAMGKKGMPRWEAGTTPRVSGVPSLVGLRARVRTRPCEGRLAENLDLYPGDAATHSKRGGGA